jgi:hypothetical protein
MPAPQSLRQRALYTVGHNGGKAPTGWSLLHFGVTIPAGANLGVLILPTTRRSSRRHPKPDRRRALELLASCPEGCSEAIMLTHGFTTAQMVELVRRARERKRRACGCGPHHGRDRAGEDHRGGAAGAGGELLDAGARRPGRERSSIRRGNQVSFSDLAWVIAMPTRERFPTSDVEFNGRRSASMCASA